MPTAIKLIVGLGNPGPDHALTRHNAGFWFVDALAEKNKLGFRSESRFHAEVCRLAGPPVDCFLCKPSSFMNRSGMTVAALAAYYRIVPEEILVVHDEIDLPPGVVRIKLGGGHGGHNGLRDIIEVLGDNNFNRLRIGVGHPGHSDEVADYVLDRAPAPEETLIMQGIASALDLLPQILSGEFQKVMNLLHRSEREIVKDEKESDVSNSGEERKNNNRETDLD